MRFCFNYIFTSYIFLSISLLTPGVQNPKEAASPWNLLQFQTEISTPTKTVTVSGGGGGGGGAAKVGSKIYYLQKTLNFSTYVQLNCDQHISLWPFLNYSSASWIQGGGVVKYVGVVSSSLPIPLGW